MKKIRVAVVGATGYTGEELVRILSRHPKAEVTYVSGKEDRGEKIQDIFPYLQKTLDLPCNAFSMDEAVEKADVFFLALPHTVSMNLAPKLLEMGKKVIDVSADYRLHDKKTYEKFYKLPHTDAANLGNVPYGIPEIHRKEIASAHLIANPGCYPTAAILGLLPGIKKGLFDTKSIYIDAKSGVTGAGRKSDKGLIFGEVSESLKAYKVFEHQHVPEIDQELSQAGGKKISVVFVPHLLPINRGILSTMYVKLNAKMTAKKLLAVYKVFYKDSPFVKVYDEGRLPEIKHVAHTNFCDIGIRVNEEKQLAVIVSAIDNLGKGAAGQAIQNMNIMCGFAETDGL